MKSRIIADGERRLRESRAHQERLRQLHAAISAQYAAELATAGFVHRWFLRCRIELEYRRERKRMMPSQQSLYVHSLAPRPLHLGQK